MHGLLTDIRELTEYLIFQQDSAPAHIARETVELLQTEIPDFIPPSYLCPTNSPHLNPVDYTIWSVMKEEVYRYRIHDINELHHRIVEAREEMDQPNGGMSWRKFDLILRKRILRCRTDIGRHRLVELRLLLVQNCRCLKCTRTLVAAFFATTAVCIILMWYMGGDRLFRWKDQMDVDRLMRWQKLLKAMNDQSLTERDRLLTWQKQLKRNNARNLTVICMIFTTPDKWLTRGVTVQNTWSRRCPRSVFFYSKSSANCPNHAICNVSNSVGLDVPEGRDHLTGKTMEALKYCYKTFGKTADWYLKADDDVYIFFENFLEVLSWYNSTSPRYLGQTIHTNIPKGYHSGGAGYVLSKAAVAKMLENSTQLKIHCKGDGSYEDVDIGSCLAGFGVYPEDMRDAEGKMRFHSQNPLRVLSAENFLDQRFINMQEVFEMLGRHTTSFHYVTPGEMYFFEFLVYHLRQ